MYTLHGERSPTIFRHGRRSCAATCQITRENVAIIDICMVVFGSIALFFTACWRVVTLTALQTAAVFVCAHDYRAVPTVQAVLQTATAVVCSHDLVIVVGTGGLYAVVEWIPAAM